MLILELIKVSTFKNWFLSLPIYKWYCTRYQHDQISSFMNEIHIDT